MSNVIKNLLGVLHLLWVCVVFAFLVSFLAFAVALFIGLFFQNSFTALGEALVFAVVTFFAVIFLAGLDRVRWKMSVARYVRALPRVDARSYCEAYPGYEKAFLLEVRQLIAGHLKIDPDKVSPELDLSTSPLDPYPLFDALFKHYRPSASPELQMPTSRTARHARPAHIVDFPIQEVKTLHDLLREIDRLKHCDPLAPNPDAVKIESAASASSRLGTGSLTISTGKMSSEEYAYLKSCAKTNPVSKWISRVIFSYDEGPLNADIAGGVVEICVVAVERVAVGIQGGNEGPILFLDLGYNDILALNGEWMFQEQFMKVADRIFDQWDAENSFFKAFYLRRAPKTGRVLSLKVTDETLIQSERSIPHRAIPPFGESRFLQGSLDTLENDLKVLEKLT